jgi:hypothetical protein
MFRFSIRDVLWLTVVAALAVAWWLEHRRQQSRIDLLEEEARLFRQMPWHDIDLSAYPVRDLVIPGPGAVQGAVQPVKQP